MNNHNSCEKELRELLIEEIGQTDNLSTNDLITLYRRKKGLSQIEFGRLCDINNSYVSQVESSVRNINQSISKKFISGIKKLNPLTNNS